LSGEKIFVTIKNEKGEILQKEIEIDDNGSSISLDELGIKQELNIKNSRAATKSSDSGVFGGVIPFDILPHNKNYILPFTYSFNKRGGENQKDEAEFQISFKKLLLKDIFDFDLYMGYTQRSFWQIYNNDNSRPFRESNYAPELYFEGFRGVYLNPFLVKNVRFGYLHQSNGGDITNSRSWDRLFVSGDVEYGDVRLRPKIWVRIPEKDKSDPLDPSGDDNPDIERYLGYGEVSGIYNSGRHFFELTLRDNLEFKENRGSAAFEYYYKTSGGFYLYGQIFSGYGESLIDYDRDITKVGVGVLLNLD